MQLAYIRTKTAKYVTWISIRLLMIHSCLRAVIGIPPISLGRRRTKRISYFPMPITQLVYPPKFCKRFACNFSWVLRSSRETASKAILMQYIFWGGGREQFELWQILSYASHKSSFWTVEQIVLSISNKLTEKAFLDTTFVQNSIVINCSTVYLSCD